jgi:tRNA A37 threonylcarbamoyltransferase TsaD
MQVAHSYQILCRIPSMALCNDNAVMIAWCGMEYVNGGRLLQDDIVDYKPTWHMEHLS